MKGGHMNDAIITQPVGYQIATNEKDGVIEIRNQYTSMLLILW